MTIKEFATLCGVSVRTLHYYDQQGLLTPAGTTEAGYRLYGENEAQRLQQIFFFREMGFPLAQIKEILDDPSFDRREALQKQEKLLLLERDRLDRLIRLVERNLKGEIDMSVKEFDRSEINAAKEEYCREAKEKWGNTAAWRSFEKKGEPGEAAQAEADEIFRGFAALPAEQVDTAAGAALVKRWQQHLTRYYYECTPEILAGLAEMYVGDDRFLTNIDGQFGKGTAEKMTAAIRASLKN